MKLSNLAGILRGAGLTVVETAGWANRGYAGQDLQDVRGVLWHHTATHRSRYDASDAPTLSMCINGRSDLPGPLCNIVFGRTGVVYLVAAGVANHAGAGSAHNIPTNWGNHYLIGIEMESSGIAPWDWTAEQLRVAPFLGAALERAYGIDLQIAHYEYSSQGKIDPAGWPGGMDGLRASINAALTGSLSYASESITPVQEDDMATVPQAEWEWAKQVLTALSDNAATKKDLAGVPDAVLTKQVPYKDPVTGQDTGQTTSLATMAGFADFQASQTRALVQQGPAGVAEQINAAGLAEAVRDELVKLIGGK